jgi:hypothetical protein
VTAACPRCRADNLPSHRFCVECGQALQASCPRCGFAHEPGARFCGGCGQPILASDPVRFASPETYTPPHLAEKIRTSRGTLEGERKQVTVLFADMKGPLELLADRDPEDARRMLDPVLAVMMEVRGSAWWRPVRCSARLAHHSEAVVRVPERRRQRRAMGHRAPRVLMSPGATP